MEIGGLCSFYLINLFPEFQIPCLHFCPPYKKAGLKGNVKQSFRVHNPLSSQITVHLNKAHIFNPQLCLLDLVVTGSMNTNFSSFIWSTEIYHGINEHDFVVFFCRVQQSSVGIYNSGQPCLIEHLAMMKMVDSVPFNSAAISYTWLLALEMWLV